MKRIKGRSLNPPKPKAVEVEVEYILTIDADIDAMSSSDLKQGYQKLRDMNIIIEEEVELLAAAAGSFMGECKKLTRENEKLSSFLWKVINKNKNKAL